MLEWTYLREQSPLQFVGVIFPYDFEVFIVFSEPANTEIYTDFVTERFLLQFLRLQLIRRMIKRTSKVSFLVDNYLMLIESKLRMC